MSQNSKITENLQIVFNETCKNVVKNISPFKLYEKGEREQMVSNLIDYWVLQELYLPLRICEHKILVSKIGQSKMEVILKYQTNSLGVLSPINEIKSLQSIITRDEGFNRLNNSLENLKYTSALGIIKENNDAYAI